MYVAGRAEIDRRLTEAKETVRAYNDCLQQTTWNPALTEQMTRLSARGMYLLEQLVFESGLLLQQLDETPDLSPSVPDLPRRVPAPVPDDAS